LIVAIGSTNPVKVGAVRRVILEVWPEAHLHAVAVASGVSAMPMSDEEGERGALVRATRAREQLDAHLGVGLEGAVHELPLGMYVTNWVAVVARDGRSSVAAGARLPVPECVARQVRAGVELGNVIDHLSGQTGSKQHQGTAGFLTRGLVPREEAFRIAVAFAMVPFLRPELYARQGDMPSQAP
jgi:inosine/xanthosine triphosphatase